MMSRANIRWLALGLLAVLASCGERTEGTAVQSPPVAQAPSLARARQAVSTVSLVMNCSSSSNNFNLVVDGVSQGNAGTFNITVNSGDTLVLTTNATCNRLRATKGAVPGMSPTFWTVSSPSGTDYESAVTVINATDKTSGITFALNEDPITGQVPKFYFGSSTVLSAIADKYQANVNITIVTPEPDAPQKPVGVSGNGSATVNITGATTGSSPTSFTVTSNPGNFTCTDTSLTGTGSAKTGSCVITGLTNGTAYTFTATATNSTGTSLSSVPSDPVTPAPPPPNAPTLTSAASNRDQKVPVYFTTASTGTAPTSVEITASPGGATCTTSVNGLGTSWLCEVTGLTNETTYTFTAVAKNVNPTPSAVSNSVTGTPDTDADGDGLYGAAETLLGTLKNDADTDNDGLCDGDQNVVGVCSRGEDFNVNGVKDSYETDPLDADSDNDGVPDGKEGGVTNALDPDRDNDGLCDGPSSVAGTCRRGEDMDADGVVDANETDPDDFDSDNDTITDDPEYGSGTNPLDTDSDGTIDARDLDSDEDGFTDSQEKMTDFDNDLVPNCRDSDSDADGLQDKFEDSLADSQDVDSDSDGLCDGNVSFTGICKAGEDLNLNGVLNPNETNPTTSDTDSDGISDLVEFGPGATALDWDSDGTVDARDFDSDNDTLQDINEGAGDADGDGIPNFRDLDSDNDGVVDQSEKGADQDNDGTPDYQDTDSDNDGIFDSQEAGLSPTSSDGRVPGPYDSKGKSGTTATTCTVNANCPSGSMCYQGACALDTDDDGI
ncbi:MAG: Outer rane porin, partial [Pseudomonadota bacterium]